MTDAVLIYVTHPNHSDAVDLARFLVERKLAAAVNLLPGMETVYRWQGEVECGQETVMIVKSRRALVEAIQNAVLSRHPYECPCFVVIDIAGSSPAYLDWVHSSTKP